jgi:bifunctional DNA-binding transcriptional regulator/antitoxin component of YhaV-PrlF toxin-antitoxin module
MTYQLKLSSQNQITLPVELLEQLKAKSGQFIEIVKSGNQFVIRTFRDTLEELDLLTKDLQTKTKQLQKTGNFDLDKIIDISAAEFYQKKV